MDSHKHEYKEKVALKLTSILFENQLQSANTCDCSTSITKEEVLEAYCYFLNELKNSGCDDTNKCDHSKD